MVSDSSTETPVTAADDVHVYHDLIDYFARGQLIPPKTIAHPDPAVNEMVDGEIQTLRRAAVLLPITRLHENQSSDLVLTVRSANLKSHAGQISLPGGTSEDIDQNSVATALRESEEEIGLKAKNVEVLGQLGDLALPSGFHVTPIVGIVDRGLDFVACPDEVADIFQAPLDLVLDITAYKKSAMTFNNQQRTILELMYEDYRIWGATAAILYHLALEIRDWRKSRK
ncbi:MAG: CoA pyrophosphatase [Gammaproteobacteria bacterium]|nr:CoA pyrophosphatase [Gammaproteobacteria bacterium]